MYVLIKYSNKVELRHFKHKFIRYWLCIIINKIKDYEVEVLEDE